MTAVLDVVVPPFGPVNWRDAVAPSSVLAALPERLLDWTRGRSADPFDRTIDVTVSRLRRKLEAGHPSGALLLTTIRNGGYLFTAQVFAGEVGEG